MRQRQVEIIAAEDQMLADRDAVEEHLPPLRAADADEREIGRPAADVADEDLLPRLDARMPIPWMERVMIAGCYAG